MFFTAPDRDAADPQRPVPERSSWQAVLFSRRALYLALLVVLLTAMSSLRAPQWPDVQTGERAPETIIVPTALEFTDHELTAAQRRLAAENAPRVFRLELTRDAELRDGLTQALTALQAETAAAAALGTPARQRQLLAAAEETGRRLLLRGVVATEEEAARLAAARRVRLLRLTATGDTLVEEYPAGGLPPVIVRSAPVDSFVALATLARTPSPETVGRLLAASLPVNLTFVAAATRQQEQEAERRVQPVLINVPEGEILIHKGARLTAAQSRVLNELRQTQARFDGMAVVGFALLFSVTLMAFLMFLYKFYPETYADERGLLLLALLFILPLAICKLLQLVTTLPANLIYLMPVPAVSALVALLFHPRLAVYFNVFAALALAVFAGTALVPFIVHWGAGMVAIFAVARIQRRSHVVRAGLWVAAAMIVLLLSGSLLAVEPGETRVLVQALLAALFNGVFITPVAIIGLLVFCEDLFNRTTNFRLLELADLGTDVLRELLLKAAGTYQHSLTVGMLAENAAEEIGARALLARVGAYYHDIGKLERPEYFAENQNYMEQGRHNNLKPSLSAAILKAHVKEGVTRAKAKRLPPAIIDIIRQHHGTGVMQFFYCRALEEEEDGAVNREDYQYPGPKPQTREAAIVMLADSVEAASRTMKNPTPVNIEELVKKIVNARFTEGELEECDLTLRDLQHIVGTFTRLLTSMYHSRVEYPDEQKVQALEQAKQEAREDEAPAADDDRPA